MKQSSADLAYQQIKQGILDGKYAPAQHLVETSLAEDLGVGRHGVRSALERLQTDGLVEIEPNRGASVKSLELAEVLDIIQARAVLEAGVAYLATGRITEDQIRLLEKYLNTLREALEAGNYELYSPTNKMFHQVIYEASGNETMPQLINLLRERLARLQIRTILIPGRTQQSLGEHEAIFQALKARDAAGAERAARAHMTNLSAAIERAWHLIRL